MRERTARLTAAALGASAVAACTVTVPRLAAPSTATLTAVRSLAPHRCNATTASVLDALAVQPAAVGWVYYDPRVTGGSERTFLQGYDAWVRLAGQGGDLVIRHDTACSFIGSYTTAGLRLGPGRPS